MSKKDGLLEDVDEEARAVPLGLVAVVLVLELAALLIGFNAF